MRDVGLGRHPGEFVFAPRDDTGTEDAGWLPGLVPDEHSDTSVRVVLDAAEFSAARLARVHLPHSVPPDFHGNWVSTAEIGCDEG